VQLWHWKIKRRQIFVPFLLAMYCFLPFSIERETSVCIRIFSAFCISQQVTWFGSAAVFSFWPCIYNWIAGPDVLESWDVNYVASKSISVESQFGCLMWCVISRTVCYSGYWQWHSLSLACSPDDCTLQFFNASPHRSDVWGTGCRNSLLHSLWSLAVILSQVFFQM
jgi:hypothetical protein